VTAGPSAQPGLAENCHPPAASPAADRPRTTQARAAVGLATAANILARLPVRPGGRLFHAWANGPPRALPRAQQYLQLRASACGERPAACPCRCRCAVLIPVGRDPSSPAGAPKRCGPFGGPWPWPRGAAGGAGKAAAGAQRRSGRCPQVHVSPLLAARLAACPGQTPHLAPPPPRVLLPLLQPTWSQVPAAGPGAGARAGGSGGWQARGGDVANSRGAAARARAIGG
jgi:hypothetical protein